MPHVEQELPTLPEYLSSTPDCSGVRVARSFVFYVVFCRSLLAIALFVPQYTASDYLCGIFKLFLMTTLCSKRFS